MTCREKLKIEHPKCVGSNFVAGCEGCPDDYGYLDTSTTCADDTCEECWSREATPSLDNVEVVRCIDCEFCKFNSSAEVLKCDRRGYLETVTPTDFCSWGKAKGE